MDNNITRQNIKSAVTVTLEVKAQFITVVSGNSIRDIFFKMKQFKAYLSEVKITNSFHVETSQLVCFANHLIGFYMI